MAGNSEEKIYTGELYFNGVNWNGEYGIKPMSSERLARFIQGKFAENDRQDYLARLDAKPMSAVELEAQQMVEKIRLAELEDKKARHSHLTAAPAKDGVDPTNLAQAGWAALFPAKMDAQRKEQIKEALAPLLNHRQAQAGELFAIFEDGKGYRSGERKDEFFKRQEPEIRPGPADPQQMPFYVLLIGSPAEIPYSFQFQLDVMRAVGRIDFGDDLEAYARYAQSVVLAESGAVKLPHRAAFWGAKNANDGATSLSAEYLVQPLVENLKVVGPQNEIKLKQKWQLDQYIGEGQATKAKLQALLGGDQAQTPTLLFTASHGLELAMDDPEEQRRYQGALVCQEWNGPGNIISQDDIFSGQDLTCDSCVLGMMAMFFACYGAGTPYYDQFAQQAFKVRAPIAPAGFIGALPNKLLSQGMLAVIGHVERAWGYSFVSPGGHLDNQAFITALRRIMNGDPVGLATDPSFDLRYAALASNLSHVLEELEYDEHFISEFELAHLWTANNDARNYVIVGDPAAKLPLDNGETVERPAITVDFISPEAPSPESPTVGVSKPTSQPVESDIAGAEETLIASEEVAMAFAAGRSTLMSSLTNFTDKLANAVNKAAKDISSLEVTTFSSSDLTKVTYNYEENRLSGDIKLRALTRISFDGDTQVCVPEKDDAINQALWKIHLDMVQEAQANRTEFFKAMAELAIRLIDIMKPA